MDNVNLIALALKKIGGDRDAVSPGKYCGRALVEIAYDLNVGEGYSQRIVGKVPWMALAAVLMDKLNEVTIDSVLREALALDKAVIEELGDKATEAMAELVEPTLTECSGKVTGSARVLSTTVLS